MRRWKNTAGAAFALAAMGFVLYFFGGELGSVSFASPALLRGLAGAVGIYVFVVMLGAFAWRVLLEAFGATPRRWAAERQLLVSQIGKYIPGNVAQYVGRASMALAAGTPARIVGIALVAETALIVVGGAISVVIAIAIAPEQAGRVISLLPEASNLAWIVVAIAAFGLFLFLLHFTSKRLSRFGGIPTIEWTSLGIAILLYTVALLLLGTSLFLIVSALASAPLPLTVAVFAAAWIAGLATPGAPGGLGVRESVITVGLAPFLGGAAALSAALLHRGASVLGDVISFGIGLALPKQQDDLTDFEGGI